MVRTGSYKDRKLNKAGRFYFLVSIVLLVVLFKWGFPFLVEVIAGGGSSSMTNNNADTLPPQKPQFYALPEATNSAKLVVEGYTEGLAKVTLLNNGESVGEKDASPDGTFNFDVQLTSGENYLVVTATDSAGNTSDQVNKTVNYDNEEVEITITSPAANQEFFGEGNQNIDVVGKVSKVDSHVTVNNAFARVDKDGNFSIRHRLPTGESSIEVKATDSAGNTTLQKLNVKLTL